MKLIMIPNSPMMSARHYRLAHALRLQGHEIVYLVPQLPYGLTLRASIKHLTTCLLPSSYLKDDFTIHKGVRLPYFWPYFNGLIFKSQLRRLYKKEHAEMIITETYTNETLVPRDLPYIYDIVDDYAAPADIYGSFIYKLGFKCLGVRHTMDQQTKDARAVMVVSKLLNDYAAQLNKNVFVIDNGVDKKIIDKLLENSKQTNINRYSIIYVSNFGPWSGVVKTLHAIRELRKKYPDVTLTLVGGGSEVPKILNFIKEYHADTYVKYLGFVEDRTILFDLINRSAIGLNISDKNKWRDAAQPIKVLEYSALGKKIVSTDLNEVINLEFPNVFIYSEQDEKKSLKIILDEALADTRSRNDFRMTQQYVLRHYDWDRSAEKISNILSKVTESLK